MALIVASLVLGLVTQTITAPAPRATTVDDIFDAVFDRSLDFRIEMGFDDVVRFIRRIDQYNDFEAGAVIDALEAIDQLIPKSWYGPGNPNNGHRTYRISIGREGSPVIYLERMEHAFSTPLAEETLKTICSEIELWGHADEATSEVLELSSGSRLIRFRFWWD